MSRAFWFKSFVDCDQCWSSRSASCSQPDTGEFGSDIVLDKTVLPNLQPRSACLRRFSLPSMSVFAWSSFFLLRPAAICCFGGLMSNESHHSCKKRKLEADFIARRLCTSDIRRDNFGLLWQIFGMVPRVRLEVYTRRKASSSNTVPNFGETT